MSLDLGFTQFYQGPVAGDGDHDWKYGGKPEFILDVDFGKLGLWNGFGAVVHGEYNYGRTPAGAGGTILPTNTAMTFPSKNEDGGDLTSVFLRQRFGRLAVLSVGKINMIDVYASGREFSGGRGIETFQHIEFVAPASGIVPPAIFGAIGTLIVPPAAVTLMVYDPKNALNRSAFEDLFEDGVTLYGTIQLGTRWFQQSGKHLFSAAWTSRDGIDLADLPYLFLPPARPTRSRRRRMPGTSRTPSSRPCGGARGIPRGPSASSARWPSPTGIRTPRAGRRSAA